MSGARVRALLLVVVSASVLLKPAPAAAQETKLEAEFRRERERLAEKCGSFDMKALVGCASTLVTDHPIHVAIGSVAPQNGFGFGGAFVPPQIKPNDDWRINWSADAVVTPSKAWRAGAYLKFVDTHMPDIGVTGPGGGTDPSESLPRPYPTFTAYGQITSLPRLAYFGLGNDTAESGRSWFEMRQSTMGGRAIWPIGRVGALNRLNLSLLGELNGRWVDVRGSTAGDGPSIDAVYDEATAPGLTTQPATLQAGEGVRLAPAIGLLQLTYGATWQQFVAPSDSRASFRRWTVDLRHELALVRNVRSMPREHNTPNDCAASADRLVGAYGCPDPLVTTNRGGSIGFRALVSRSGVSNDSDVPFYFQRTIGGSDIDGERLLASYDDYRFRGPDLLVLQETIEHVIWGPIGGFAEAEQGRVARLGESLTDGGLRHTVGAGLTLRAGGIPMVTLWWATGGSEGQHLAITMNTSLLGGSARPSLH